MATNGQPETTVIGRVISVNDRGLKLDGHETWLNISKYAVGVVLPSRGETVSLTLDKAGFIRSVAAPDGLNEGRGSRGEGRGRDSTITRLAVLKAAAEFGAARPNLKSGDVLAIAATWERWIVRDQEITFDLHDEF
jgi:hypothetical protein